MPNGPMRITSGPFEPDLYKSEMEVQDAELKVSVGWVCEHRTLVDICERMSKVLHVVVPHCSGLPSPVFQALLQSSASRKTQKKKKKKVCDLSNACKLPML